MFHKQIDWPEYDQRYLNPVTVPTQKEGNHLQELFEEDRVVQGLHAMEYFGAKEILRTKLQDFLYSPSRIKRLSARELRLFIGLVYRYRPTDSDTILSCLAVIL